MRLTSTWCTENFVIKSNLRFKLHITTGLQILSKDRKFKRWLKKVWNDQQIVRPICADVTGQPIYRLGSVLHVFGVYCVFGKWWITHFHRGSVLRGSCYVSSSPHTPGRRSDQWHSWLPPPATPNKHTGLYLQPRTSHFLRFLQLGNIVNQLKCGETLSTVSENFMQNCCLSAHFSPALHSYT